MEQPRLLSAEPASMNSSGDAHLNRLCRLDAAQSGLDLDDSRRSRIADHLDSYLQVERDNPRLIWLYSLFLSEGVVLQDGEVIAAMKKRVLDEPRLKTTAWRYLANWTGRDFQIVLHAQLPEGEPQWRWHMLVAWLEVLSGLRLTAPMPEEVQQLFSHDSLVVGTDPEEVMFRGAWMPFRILHRILEESEKRISAGTFRRFADTELVDVVTWLAALDVALDNNQAKSGWKYFSRSAAKWKADKLAMAKHPDLCWSSSLPRVQIASWDIEAIVDAWSLRQLAISQHHCADKYIEPCRDGKDRIFVIRSAEGTIVATLRIESLERTWVVKDLKGFANSAVPAPLLSVAEEIAHRYTEATNVNWAVSDGRSSETASPKPSVRSASSP